MPDKSFSIFHVILIIGVLFRFINTSLPKPDPTPSASAFIYFPLSLEPNVQVVSPLTFLFFNWSNSSLVNSNTFKVSDFTENIKNKDNIKIDVLLQLISSIRSTRSEMNVPANAVVDVNYSKISTELGALLKPPNLFPHNYLNSSSIILTLGNPAPIESFSNPPA